MSSFTIYGTTASFFLLISSKICKQEKPSALSPPDLEIFISRVVESFTSPRAARFLPVARFCFVS